MIPAAPITISNVSGVEPVFEDKHTRKYSNDSSKKDLNRKVRRYISNSKIICYYEMYEKTLIKRHKSVDCIGFTTMLKLRWKATW